MSKKVAAVDYHKCNPDLCPRGVCIAALECEHGSLMQPSPHETPEIHSAKWCRGCAKCIRACPLSAIKML